jgi:hypothetical protein
MTAPFDKMIDSINKYEAVGCKDCPLHVPKHTTKPAIEQVLWKTRWGKKIQPFISPTHNNLYCFSDKLLTNDGNSVTEDKCAHITHCPRATTGNTLTCGKIDHKLLLIQKIIRLYSSLF